MNKKRRAISCITNWVIFSVVLSVVLSACGGNRVVQTKDDSADYKSARALPPLNKNLGEKQVETAQAAEQQVATTNTTQATAFVGSELIDVNANTSRLRVELPRAEALDYLADKLIASGLTVHHRNLQAGRISIGCGDIQSEPDNKKKSRWTLSGRRTIGRLEYCALELDNNRGGTIVRVLDLNQQEVNKSHADKIFQRILVN